jgi:hypothetical protein
MLAAGANEDDVRHALAHAATCVEGNRLGSWKVSGPDCAGEELVAVVVLRDGLFVVTVM